MKDSAVKLTFRIDLLYSEAMRGIVWVVGAMRLYAEIAEMDSSSQTLAAPRLCSLRISPAVVMHSIAVRAILVFLSILFLFGFVWGVWFSFIFFPFFSVG